jgi:hypothetical protein
MHRESGAGHGDLPMVSHGQQVEDTRLTVSHDLHIGHQPVQPLLPPHDDGRPIELKVSSGKRHVKHMGASFGHWSGITLPGMPANHLAADSLTTPFCVH